LQNGDHEGMWGGWKHYFLNGAESLESYGFLTKIYDNMRCFRGQQAFSACPADLAKNFNTHPDSCAQQLKFFACLAIFTAPIRLLFAHEVKKKALTSTVNLLP
jgi:hypothetical protein